jgi:REP element-mobilizing transposase RayT
LRLSAFVRRPPGRGRFLFSFYFTPRPPANRILQQKSFMKQQTLFKEPNEKRFFGGELLNGRRKSSRPLCGKSAIHTVLKSQWARGTNAFTHRDNFTAIENLIRNRAKKYGIRIYRIAIVSDHIHLLLRAKRRWLYRAFISSLTGQIAQHVMKFQSFAGFLKRFAGEGYQKQHKEQKFWIYRPFTRILCWGRDYRNCLKYLLRNKLEALGFIKYQLRTDYYAKWRIKVVPMLV